jgi:hypothetical protein
LTGLGSGSGRTEAPAVPAVFGPEFTEHLGALDGIALTERLEIRPVSLLLVGIERFVGLLVRAIHSTQRRV